MPPMPTDLQAALYYETMPDRFVRCTLCPHDCTIAPDRRGACGVRINHGGRLFTRVGNRIVSAEIDLGSLGDETLVHGRVTTGLQWHRAEVFIGYDYYEVDQTELSGFVSGLRLWF